jgi:hypothetical protein
VREYTYNPKRIDALEVSFHHRLLNKRHDGGDYHQSYKKQDVRLSR